ncbi:MAG TPA: N-glycosylase/DNA lyase [Bacteroidota bacterium]|nr:N-glycosylase/DNA lyase [Bacteroidota bacterium]
MRRGTPYRGLEDLRRDYARSRGRIRVRLKEFARVGQAEYFYELAYCLLTPQSSAVNAAKAVELLKQGDFLATDFDPSQILFRKEHYIRFHNTKARRLLEAKRNLPAILSALASGGSPQEKRAWFVSHVKGLGWKEASHFLRNIGYRDLAILDRHILRNLRRHRIIRALPASLTPARYRLIEKKFRLFAEDVGIPMDDLDLLFWSRETGEILK